MIKKLYCRPTYSTIRATISLLKLWYSKEESDEIISLGVVSNGNVVIIYCIHLKAIVYYINKICSSNFIKNIRKYNILVGY